MTEMTNVTDATSVTDATDATDANPGIRPGADRPPLAGRTDIVRMFVNGQAMSGGSIHAPLADAEFLGPVRTAPRYRFWSFRDEFPGLEPVAASGWSVPGELYAVSYAV